MTPIEVLDIAVKAGEIKLKSGAEVYRVEMTIEKIFEAYGVDGNCFVLSSGIFATVKDSNSIPYSITLHIPSKSTHLHKLECLNNYARSISINKPCYQDALAELKKIEDIPEYSLLINLLAVFSVGFMFIFAFKGTVLEGLLSGAICVLALYFEVKLFSKYFLSFFELLLTSMFITSLCCVISRFIPGVDLSRILVSSLIFCVPGVAITTAIKDALFGDILSSAYNIFNTIFIAVALSLGVLIILFINGGGLQ